MEITLQPRSSSALIEYWWNAQTSVSARSGGALAIESLSSKRFAAILPIRNQQLRGFLFG
jgi:hypothetical protein